MELSASRERPEQIVDGEIEMQWRVSRVAVISSNLESADGPFHEMRNVGMCDDHAFRITRGTRGEHDVRSVGRIARAGKWLRRPSLPLLVGAPDPNLCRFIDARRR